MSKKTLSWLLVVIVAIGIIFFVFVRPSNISSPNQAAVITTEVERQAMIDKINADIANYQKLVDDLKLQINSIVNTPAPTVAPVVTVTPATTTLSKGKTLQLGAEYKDDHGLVTAKTFTWSTSSSIIASVSSTGLVAAKAAGTATITATTGTTKGTAKIVVVVPDTTLPTVSITSPTRGKVVSGTINITASASDNVGVTKVELYSNGTLVTTLPTAPYTVSIDTKLSTNGVKSLTAKAYDAAGNVRTSSAVSITIKNTVATTPTCPTTIPSNAFLTCFYSGTNFGTFLVSRTDTAINYNWVNASPMTGVPVDSFSMRSTGNFTFQAGTYTFTHTGDDGTRLYIDGTKVDDQWTDHSATTYTIDKAMIAGTHKVTLEYYENGGEAEARLSWAKKAEEAVTCTAPLTVTTTLACPSGQTGSITETRTKGPAPACALSVPVVVNTCATTATAPTVSVSVSPTSITSGQSTTLSWSSANATSCTASIGWSGSRTIEGSIQVSPTANTTYTLECSGAGGKTTKSAMVTVNTGTTNTNPPGSDATMPNEPTTGVPMTKFLETSFSTLSGGGNIQIIQDPSAPKSPGGVLQTNFTSSNCGGCSPWVDERSITPKQDVYSAVWVKLSDNYVGHSTSVAKILHFWGWNIGGDPCHCAGNVAVFVIRGVGAGPFVPSFGLQALAGNYNFGGTPNNTSEGGELNPNLNVSKCVVNRGEWHKYEMYVHNNTIGKADGTIEYWMDGIKCGDYKNIMFVAANAPDNKWHILKMDNTWGGVGGTITTPFYQYFDHWYASGRDPVTGSTGGTSTGNIPDSGWTKYADISGVSSTSSLVSKGWDIETIHNHLPSVNIAVVANQDSLVGAPNTLAMKYPVGLPGGSSGDSAITVIPEPVQTSTVKVVQTFKLSSNFVGHSTGTNKMTHIFIGNNNGDASNKLYTSLWGQGSNNNGNYFVPGVGNQGVGDENLSSNAVVERNKWYKLTTIAKINTPGVANGIIDQYLDSGSGDVQIMHKTNVNIMKSTQGNKVTQVSWSPTWGGDGGKITQEQFMYTDQLEVYIK